MKVMKELIRTKWAAMEDTARRNKKSALIAAGATALLVTALSYYGPTEIKEHADEHKNEKAHVEAAVVHLSEEAQKASGVEVMAAAMAGEESGHHVWRPEADLEPVVSKDPVVDHNRGHYDSVIDAWKFILGENLHWGYFRDPREDPDAATDSLIDVLAGMSPPAAGTRVLDVGCGRGGPALLLHE